MWKKVEKNVMLNRTSIEKYGHKSIVNKCTLDLSNLRAMMKRSDIKTNIKNYFLK